ncbi:MAG: hypothetical protein LUD51_07055 [Clostridia bacterium]|nr:hypothetical protein [Clostridia bacterium]
MTAYEEALDWIIDDIDRFMGTPELLADKAGWEKLYSLRRQVEELLCEAIEEDE